VTVCEVVTGCDVTANVALVAPLTTLTVAGTVATAAFELLRVTVAPFVGAALDSVTVPVTGNRESPIVLDVESVKPCKLTGKMVKEAVFATEPSLAEIVTTTLSKTETVGMLMLALNAPLAIKTLAGGFASTELEVIAIFKPSGGAKPVKVTVPVAMEPPVSEFGKTAIPLSVAGLIVNFVVDETAPSSAPIDTVDEVATPEVVIANVPVVAPAEIVIVDGTCALTEPELSAMT
jgi:hypothetical protein